MNPLGITIGDAAGVGPELVLRCAADVRAAQPFVVFGSVRVLRAALDDLRRRGVPVTVDEVARVDTPAAAAATPLGVLPVLDVGEPRSVALSPYPWGQATPAFGRLQFDALTAAIDAALRSDISALVTAPWHKALLQTAGLPPTGHTEVLAERTGAADPVMLLAGERLRVALATIHIPIADVPGALSTQSIVRTATSLARGLTERYGIDSPRIAVCGLNPHAGESGTIGSEDAAVIEPAVRAMRRAGIDAIGPLSADTLFPSIVAGRMHADAVLAMYHDQGLVALKTIHFGESANVTLGLPIIRTSVDHGTAYDIAGSGVADTGSFVYAAKLASRMAARVSDDATR